MGGRHTLWFAPRSAWSGTSGDPARARSGQLGASGRGRRALLDGVGARCPLHQYGLEPITQGGPAVADGRFLAVRGGHHCNRPWMVILSGTPWRWIAFLRKRSAASVSRCSVSRKSIVWPYLSTAR